MMVWLLAALFQLSATGWGHASDAVVFAPAQPLVMGETFRISSSILGEQRVINVYVPPAFGDAAAAALPVIYMPDGGIQEDFLHVAGLVQVSVGSGTMRPHLLVGIENTERRRDMTPPTRVEADRKIAPRVGGAEKFRAFIRDELMPEIRKRYRTTGSTAIVGESLAGLFIVDTFMKEPAMFDQYIAIDPSLWWNDRQILKDAPTALSSGKQGGKTIFIATSSQAEIAADAASLDTILINKAPAGMKHILKRFDAETHATIYHPAALSAFRELFAPAKP
jgi:predicted alpha/beta superfamily hydrolase